LRVLPPKTQASCAKAALTQSNLVGGASYATTLALSVGNGSQSGAKNCTAATDKLTVNRIADGIEDRNPANVECILPGLRLARHRHDENE
jgi:hypothetical protein